MSALKCPLVTGNTYFPLVQQLLAAKLGVPTNVQSYTKAGATLQDMLVDMRTGSGQGSPPQTQLRANQFWDVVVLQEQSAVPMWYNAAKDTPYDYTRYQNDVFFQAVSVKSLGGLVDLVTPPAGQVILQETCTFMVVVVCESTVV